MNKNVAALFIVALSVSATAQGKTLYTDELSLLLKTEDTIETNILQVLPTGTALTVIKEPSKKGFLYVRVDKGLQGYLHARHTQKTPPPAINKSIGALQADNAALKAELDALKSGATSNVLVEQLTQERDQLSKALSELQTIAASSVQLKQERDQLQAQVVTINRELEQDKLENQALKNTTNQDWFLYGGFLSLAGVILGFILPKLGWRRKSSWDSF